MSGVIYEEDVEVAISFARHHALPEGLLRALNAAHGWGDGGEAVPVELEEATHRAAVTRRLRLRVGVRSDGSVVLLHPAQPMVGTPQLTR